jgi:hypothetical protein
MYGRVYFVNWDAATAITAQIDLFEIQPADDKPVAIHELRVWQTTDLGDAAEEIIGIQFIRGFTSSGSGGGTPTVGLQLPGDSAASFTAECRNTTLANTGTTQVLHSDAWNVRIPYIWTPTPEDRPVVTQANTTLVARLMAAPADSLTMFASITVEELT